jgi:hypothetical protein
MNTYSQLWRSIGANHEQIKIVFALVVALWTLYEYKQHIAESRVAESLKYIERYQRDPVLTARHEYANYWLLGEGSDLLRKTPKKDWNSLIDKKPEEHLLERHVFTLTSFYIDVALCTKHKLCDKRTSCQYFKADMDALRNSHSKLLERWENAWRESFRLELDEFVTSLCASPA